MAGQIDTFVIAFIVGAVPSIISAILVRKKTKAESADIVADAASTLANSYMTRLKELESDIRSLKEQLKVSRESEITLRERVRELEYRLSQINGKDIH